MQVIKFLRTVRQLAATALIISFAGPVSGQLVINEVMQNPDAVYDSAGEWFEIHNPSSSDVDIDGWTIRDNDYDTHVVNNGGPLMVPAGGYLILGNNTDMASNGGVPVAYSYGSEFYLSNSEDELVLEDGSMVEQDRVEWDGGLDFPDPTGASMSLKTPALDNNDGVNWCTASTPFGAGDLGTPGTANDCPDLFGECGDEATFIYVVQGAGMSSPLNGVSDIVLEGVVVGDFQDRLSGFFLQEENSDADGNSQTSDGIFVYGGAIELDVEPGDVVRVQGTVNEYYNLTQLTSLTQMKVCGVGTMPTAADINLPLSSIDEWESTEGMAVIFPQKLYVTDNYNLTRYGEVDLAVGGPLDMPTNVVEPGSDAALLKDLNDSSRVMLDDAGTDQHPLPSYLGVDNTLRTGDSVVSLKGVLNYAYGRYKVCPTSEVGFVRENHRPSDPPDVGGGLLKVASYNTLNYFTTLDNSGPVCGPSGDMECRGADNEFEFGRQKTKLVSALTTLDVDVVGLIELENATDNTPISDLVDGLNAVAGTGTWEFINTGAIGTDAIRQGLIFKPASVAPIGEYQILDSSVDPNFLDNLNRPALAQTFEENSTGKRFTVVVNHLKSKGSPCDDVGDPDTGDGQGNCNLVRSAAAEVLVNWLSGDPTGSGALDFLIIGDLNSYAMEDPIAILEAGGYTDLVKLFVGTGFADGAYSYSYYGESGYLDHALASTSLKSEVSTVAYWHINADEPSGLDYNDYNQESLFSPDPYRSSDHDALIVGLFLDEDDDEVWDEFDMCPGTEIPESVPLDHLLINRFALVDADGIFDTVAPGGTDPDVTFDIFDTAGCSCEQIIKEQRLGRGHRLFGCSIREMREWVKLVSQP